MAGIPQPSIGNLPWVECECGSKMYKSRMMFKKCSSILSPSGKEENIPVEVVICAECGRIPDFIAKNIGIENT